MNNKYDFIVIGAGISACTFATYLNSRLPNTSILLVDHGRRIGGRSTTRESRSYPNLEFDHGLPSINLSKELTNDLKKFILPLIKTKTLIDITTDILVINNNSDIDYLINQPNNHERIYRGFPYMNRICQEIIQQSVSPSNIHFLYQSLIKSFRKENNSWEILVDCNNIIKSSNLVISSSLVIHPRCLDIMKIKTLPLRNAFSKGEDELIEALIRETSTQKHLKRRNYILYIRKSSCVEKFTYKYLQMFFSQDIQAESNFEKIIFQKQSDGSMVIVLHCSYINKFVDKTLDMILSKMIKIFCKHENFVDLFRKANLIDEMDWRASQPLDKLVPNNLQFSLRSSIGFCGDWFDFDGCSGVERAMKSSIRLARLFT
tara:strand:+ start:552 stop:1673 length:1122 start_codon:yes stop_codon:yes gene_type:complete